MIKDLKPSLNQNVGSEKLSFVNLEFMHVCDLRLSEITHGLTLARCTLTADCGVNTLESGSSIGFGRWGHINFDSLKGEIIRDKE